MSSLCPVLTHFAVFQHGGKWRRTEPPSPAADTAADARPFRASAGDDHREDESQDYGRRPQVATVQVNTFNLNFRLGLVVLRTQHESH